MPCTAENKREDLTVCLSSDFCSCESSSFSVQVRAVLSVHDVHICSPGMGFFELEYLIYQMQLQSKKLWHQTQRSAHMKAVFILLLFQIIKHLWAFSSHRKLIKNR